MTSPSKLLLPTTGSSLRQWPLYACKGKEHKYIIDASWTTNYHLYCSRVMLLYWEISCTYIATKYSSRLLAMFAYISAVKWLTSQYNNEVYGSKVDLFALFSLSISPFQASIFYKGYHIRYCMYIVHLTTMWRQWDQLLSSNITHQNTWAVKASTSSLICTNTCSVDGMQEKEINYLLKAHKDIIFNRISKTMIKWWCIDWSLKLLLLIRNKSWPYCTLQQMSIQANIANDKPPTTISRWERNFVCSQQL